jgi:threonine/homoserine/homoserine lactone efflux protein
MIVAALIGLVLGFFGSVPVAGPTSVLVIKDAFEQGGNGGVDIAVGAAVAEAIYALVAFWGLTAVLVRFPVLASIARVLGDVLFVGICIYLVLAKKGRKVSQDVAEGAQGRRWIRGFVSAIVNPTLIVTWTSAVAALHATGMVQMRPSGAVPFAVGVGLGIIGWFAFLVKIVERFRGRMRPESLGRVARGMGWAMIAIGMILGSRTLWHLTFT